MKFGGITDLVEAPIGPPAWNPPKPDELSLLCQELTLEELLRIHLLAFLGRFVWRPADLDTDEKFHNHAHIPR